MGEAVDEPNTIRRAIAAIVGVQVAIAAALLVTDLTNTRPGANPMTLPGPSGPATRPYDPNRRPALPGETPETGPMPDRLEISGEGAVMTLTGQIAPGDGTRIGQELSTRDGAGQAVDTVRIDSTGGSVFDALEIGQTLRDRGINTEVPDSAVCLSACPYVFAGGVERSVAATARLGVHQSYYGQNTILPAFMAVEDIQRGQAEVMAYLTRMGIDLGVMEHALRTPPEQIYILSREELVEFGLLRAEES